MAMCLLMCLGCPCLLRVDSVSELFRVFEGYISEQCMQQHLIAKVGFEFKMQVGAVRFRAAALYTANIIFDQCVAKCSEGFSSSFQ